jgi:DNA-binding transcriptional LysR family regulator
MVVVWIAELLYAVRMNMPTPQGPDRIELMATFVSIVESGSLSAAANRLGTTQPTISRRLQILEKWLGVKLVQRSTHAMNLTEDGERFLAHSRQLLENWSSMEEELRGATSDPFGTLRIVVPHAFGQDQLVAPLLAFLGRYPKLSVEWLLHRHRPDFIAEGVDCEIRLGSVEDPSQVAVRLAEVPRIVVAAPSLLAQKSDFGMDALPGLPWIALNLFYRDTVALTHRTTGENRTLAITPRLSTDSVYTTHQAALAGFGATLISTWMVKEDLEQGRLVQLVPEWQGVSLPVYLVYPYAHFYPARLRRFVELMRETLPTLVGTNPAPEPSARNDQ